MALHLRPRKHPGIRGRRPDRKLQRRDDAIMRARRRGDSAERILQLYVPKGEALPI